MRSVAHSSAVDLNLGRVPSAARLGRVPSAARCNATGGVAMQQPWWEWNEFFFDYWVGTRAGIGIRSASVWVVGVVLVSLDALVQSRQE